MGRVRRLTYAGAYYHVISRGINGRKIFLEMNDYRYYLHRLRRYSNEYEAYTLTFGLMPNHIHLQIHTHGDTLSQMMKPLNSSNAYPLKSQTYENVIASMSSCFTNAKQSRC